MRVRGPLLLLAAAALAAPVAVSPAAAQAPAQRDWTAVVERTAEGGFRMGNPDAPVKLVEFVSLTCPHCADFAEAALPTLVGEHVRSGRVSLEYRNFVLNVIDLAAAMVTRCADPASYFDFNHRLLSEQRTWVARAERMKPGDWEEIEQMDADQALERLATATGLYGMAAQHGLPRERVNACLADGERLAELQRMGEAAHRDLGVAGTPSFMINGRLLADVYEWSQLEPLLRSPGS